MLIPFAVPDAGSTLFALAISFAALVALRKRLQKTDAEVKEPVTEKPEVNEVR
ncbi:MAG: hypothetical protein JWL90_12 [Chthoniobacteraceae bacterium]|nr:hypothetical protein [Chthoniobacteraceae bacterium]